MFESKESPPQATLWLATQDLVVTPAHSFYERLDRAFTTIGFADAVRTLCAPFYEMDATRGGRPGIDPVVYFKMLLIGFFENLASERAIAARCADSLAIRAFLHYTLTEPTPDHSSLTVIRQRLDAPVYQAVFGLVLVALKRHKLLKGKRLAIDASIVEANASLRTLAHRLTGETYQAYIARLAGAAGVDPQDHAAVRRFDKKRPGRKTRNQDWQNPHDPEAKVGKTKRGATRMVYKPDHVVDLDTGAIVDVEVQPGDAHDTKALADRVLMAETRLQQALAAEPQVASVQMVVLDKGYYKVEELATVQTSGIKTAIRDPLTRRRIERLTAGHRRAVRAAQRTVTSPTGQALMRRRGERAERSFQHVLDCGGGRRTTLRGRTNIEKRYRIQAMGANLSLLMRHLVGVGTPKQALAASRKGLAALRATLSTLRTRWTRRRAVWMGRIVCSALAGVYLSPIAT